MIKVVASHIYIPTSHPVDHAAHHYKKQACEGAIVSARPSSSIQSEGRQVPSTKMHIVSDTPAGILCTFLQRQI